MIRWGFLGAGFVASRALAPAVHAAAGARLLAVASRDVARARALRPERVYAGYADLLADADIDAVYVALTNEAHLPWTLAALRAGKHVLCEKPLALSAAEVDEMALAAVSAGRVVVEASWYRWHPRVRLTQRLLADGAIGAVRHVSAGFIFGGVPAGNYRLDPARGGGALYDVGCYAVSACLWAFGTASPSGELVLPCEVAARSTYGPTGVDLAVEAILTFDDGEAQLRVGIDEAEGQWLVVTGDGGELELPGAPYTCWLDTDSELLLSDGRGTERIPVPAVDAYRVMVEEVSSVLTGGAGWVLPLAESRACAVVLDAIAGAAEPPPKRTLRG